jgi:hypothetical protein
VYKSQLLCMPLWPFWLLIYPCILRVTFLIRQRDSFLSFHLRTRSPVNPNRSQSSGNGGLWWQPREVGFPMSTLGAIGVIIQMVIYRKLNACFGTIKVWHGVLFSIACALAPFLALVASLNLGSAEEEDVCVWFSMFLIPFLS